MGRAKLTEMRSFDLKESINENYNDINNCIIEINKKKLIINKNICQNSLINMKYNSLKIK